MMKDADVISWIQFECADCCCNFMVESDNENTRTINCPECKRIVYERKEKT